MFTGIISHTGEISRKTKNKLLVRADKTLINKFEKGASIAVNGICFSVLNNSGNEFEVEFMPETNDRTNIKYLKAGDLVNLELPATPNTFLSGSIVQGHIDGVSKIVSIRKRGNSKIFKFSIHRNLSRYIVSKGSITVNGVSLTVISVNSNSFTVGVIPHTFNNTNFKDLKIEDYVNVEVDIIGKYVEKMININSKLKERKTLN